MCPVDGPISKAALSRRRASSQAAEFLISPTRRPPPIHWNLPRREPRRFPKWGIVETFSHPLGLSGRHWENGYTQGSDAGSISLTAPAMALDGTLRGHAIEGLRQREQSPDGGALSLTFSAQDATHPLYLPFSPTPTSSSERLRRFQGRTNSRWKRMRKGAPLRADRSATVEISPSLFSKNGFASLSIENPEGTITLPQSVELHAPAGGSVKLSAANLDILGNITAPNGPIALTAFNIAPGIFQRLRAQTTPPPVTPPPNIGRGIITVAPGATLNTAGLVIDERPGKRSDIISPIALDGGTITSTGYSVSLAQGSVLDISGGLRITPEGEKSWGSAGSISIKAGQDPNLLSVVGGQLDLGATLRGFSGSRGAGSLEIQAPLIQIGGSAQHRDTLLISPEFFSNGGFGNFALSGLGIATGGADEFLPGVLIAPGTVIAPVAQSVLAESHGGPEGGVRLTPFTKPTRRTRSRQPPFQCSRCGRHLHQCSDHPG